jgi:hypothetical protein
VVGLNVARVIIVDDVEAEVLDLVRALWKIGVSPLYIDPTTLKAGDAPQSLSGVRLAFLDMDIVGAGADPASKVAALANCLRRVIVSNNGPYIAIAWTKHPELVDELDAYIFPKPDIPRPSAFITIAKEDCKDIAAISARIDAELAKRGPVRMLQAWEEASMMAGSEVVGELAGIASGEEDDPEKWREAWGKAMLRIMRSCGMEFAGESGMSDGAAAFKAFCHSLIPLHSDKLERRISPSDPSLDEITKILLSKDARTDPGIRAKARINSMLHCSLDNLKTPQAGSVYLLGPMKLKRYFPSLEVMVRPLVPKRKDTSDKEYKAQVAEFASKIIPIAVETSPACDHVQGNLIIPRLTAGYLVPMDVLHARLKKGSLPQSIWRLSPLWLSIDGGAAAPYGLLVNCLLVSSCSTLLLKRKQAAFRIRSQAFATLQVCFGGHAARPGMLLLT